MKSIVLLYDEKEFKQVEEAIVPIFEEQLKLKLPFNTELFVELGKDDFVVTYLSDDQLKELLPYAIENNWRIGLLPHPKMTHARQGLGVDAKLKASLEHLLAAEDSMEIDVLMANGRPVFNTLVIGESFSVMTGSIQETAWKKFRERVGHFFDFFRVMKAHLYTLEVKDRKPLHTACLGMVIVQHGQSSLLSRRVLENSYVNDGRMHVIALSPRSITGLFWFGFTGLFRLQKPNQLPPFAGHIKTSALKILSNQPINYTLDGTLMSSKELELEVLPKVIRIVPGRHLHVAENPSSQDVFNVKILPTGESKDELVDRPLPLIYHASTEEFKELFTVLRENARTSSNFLVLMVLSTFIATLGLFGNSSPVIIGAMILAPLMAPIISMSMGVLRQDKNLILGSLKAILWGLSLAYLCAVLITWLTPLNIPNEEIMARVRPNLLDLGVAVGSGIAGAYAHAKEEVAKTLAGVAIAVALVPPLAVSGIGLGWGDWAIFSGALLLLMTNLAGMVLAAATAFMFLGFSPFRLARKGILYALVIVGCISLPLFLGFMDMVREKAVISMLDGHIVEEVTLREISVRHVRPLRLAVKFISESNLDHQEIREVKREIERLLGEEVELEVTVGLKIE
nr:TIGR00341 family protein [Cytophagales bacterium]